MCVGSLSFEHPLISCIYPVFLLLGVLNLHTYCSKTFLQILKLSFNSLFFMDLFTLRSPGDFFLTQPLLSLKQIFSLWNPLILRIPDKPPCYVMQAVVSVSCPGDKCLLHAKLMSTALTQLPIFRSSCLLTNKGIVQCIDNSN